MPIDKNEFFKEVAVRITSTLNIKSAVKQVFKYMQEHLPLNQLYLGTYTQSTRTVRFVATATDGSKPLSEFIVFPTDVFGQMGREAERFYKPNIPTPNIVTIFSPVPHLETIAPYIKLRGKTDMVMVLNIEDNRTGFMFLRANTENAFIPEHAQLVNGLANLFTITLSNFLVNEILIKKQEKLIDDNRFLIKEIRTQTGEEVIGGNFGLRTVMEMVHQVAPQRTSVLIIGETGTGKELIANAIHLASPRMNGPFIKLNCGAISENLIDDELFGHEKGAFTGALAVKRGRFERASGGTLFLDEIGELPLQSQVRLLRVLQSRMINRVGGEKPIPVDVRIIAATHRDLNQMVSVGQFREDLWFRLNVFPIVVPPLRQRKTDIPSLIRHFVTMKSRELGVDNCPDIAPDALERITNYGWPGNVRELENLVERELIRYRGGLLRFECVIENSESNETLPAQERIEENPVNLDQLISMHINKVLKQTNGKINGSGGAAELLGVIPSTLRGKMRKLGIVYRKAKDNR